MTPNAQQFIHWYGHGFDGSSPTLEQWQSVFNGQPDQEITLINFFKLRKNAEYQDAEEQVEVRAVSGQDAFNAYAAVSIPTMEKVGGKFLFVGPFGGSFLGEPEDWDIVAIGSYPNINALVGLYADVDYRRAFPHRTAACIRQKVQFCSSGG